MLISCILKLRHLIKILLPAVFDIAVFPPVVLFRVLFATFHFFHFLLPFSSFLFKVEVALSHLKVFLGCHVMTRLFLELAVGKPEIIENLEFILPI